MALARAVSVGAPCAAGSCAELIQDPERQQVGAPHGARELVSEPQGGRRAAVRRTGRAPSYIHWLTLLAPDGRAEDGGGFAAALVYSPAGEARRYTATSIRVMHGSRISLLVVACLAGACEKSPGTGAPAAMDHLSPAPVEGFYNVAICRNRPCGPTDSIHAFALGELHLFNADTLFELRRLPENLRQSVQFASLNLDLDFSSKDATHQPLNGCVIWRTGVDTVPNALSAMAIMHWHTARDSGLVFPLFFAPDGRYDVVATIRGTSIAGRAIEGSTHSAPRVDTLVAERAGPADPARCLRAAAEICHNGRCRSDLNTPWPPPR